MVRLNPAQSTAVEHGDGPLLILAGAGSGKTRVITQRIARLIDHAVAPESIVAVSFTNKAAREMAERMAPLVGSKRAKRIRMSTFHSFGLALLKEESKAAGLNGRFTIFDQSDAMGVIKEILRESYQGGQERRFDPMTLLAQISNWKSAMLTPGKVPASESAYVVLAREIYPEYLERLRLMHAVDFDDLVCRPVQLLQENEDVRDRWRKRIRHLLVDEFQDTSEVQLQLVKLLANESRNVCVVGDDDQSIYSWRGANVGNILEFERHFPGTKLIKLETNYRSRAPILEVANAVIAAGDGKRHAKVLHAARSGGDAVRMCSCDNPAAEAQFVAAEINRLRKEGHTMEEVAVLYRSNQQARLIEEELTAQGIPYRVFGGQQFLDRKEVKDVAAYLRFVVNPYDEISLRRVINYPTRGVGLKSVQRIEEFAEQKGIPFIKAFALAPTIEDIPETARGSLELLARLFDDARETLRRSGALHGAAADLVDRIGLRAVLERDSLGEKQGERRFENVQHLLRWIERYEQRASKSNKSLQDFLQRVTLGGEKTEEEAGPGVTLCTLHAAKGLEFSTVFLIGCVEGQLPHSRTTDPTANQVIAGDPEEERRLFYVGITRARDRLYLTAARRRKLRGQIVEVTPSRYIDDLPEEHIEAYDGPVDTIMSENEFSSAIRELLESTRSGSDSST